MSSVAETEKKAALGNRQIPYPGTSWRKQHKNYVAMMTIIDKYRVLYHDKSAPALSASRAYRGSLLEKCRIEIEQQVGLPVEWSNETSRWEDLGEPKWKRRVKDQVSKNPMANAQLNDEIKEPAKNPHDFITMPVDCRREGPLVGDEHARVENVHERMLFLQETLDGETCWNHYRRLLREGKFCKSMTLIGDSTIELFLQKGNAEAYSSLKKLYPPGRKHLFLDPKELIEIVGRSVKEVCPERDSDFVTNSSFLLFCQKSHDEEGSNIPNLGPQAKHFDTKVQGQPDDPCERFCLMYLTPGVHKTVVYDMSGVPYAPSVDSFVRCAWNNEAPPELIEMLKEDSKAMELIKAYGGVACVPESKRGGLEIADQFSWAMLRSGVAHCGPPRYGLRRSVIFFVLEPPGFRDRFEPYNGETQCSEAQLIRLLDYRVYKHCKAKNIAVPPAVGTFLANAYISAMKKNMQQGAVDKTVTYFGEKLEHEKQLTYHATKLNEGSAVLHSTLRQNEEEKQKIKEAYAKLIEDLRLKCQEEIEQLDARAEKIIDQWQQSAKDFAASFNFDNTRSRTHMRLDYTPGDDNDSDSDKDDDDESNDDGDSHCVTDDDDGSA